GLTPVTIICANKGPLIAYISRSIGMSRDIFAMAQVFVVLHDPIARKVPSPRLLQAVLPLTPAEARLAHLLAAGGRLQDIASAGGLSYETVRNQLKKIFGKLGVQTQADLIAVVLALFIEDELSGR
ncbi:MAG: helix-turn-helix transcriptional regulator, partial [Rhizobiaceae bacterium]|nr:helix-turn-helix transcriptional regulator [Rhizobiaceae bacterium]